MKLSCRNCCGQCLHGSTLVFPSCAWLGKASLAESWLGFFLWEYLGGDGVGLGGLLGRFFLNSKFTFKPLPLEAAGTACGQVRATFVYGGWGTVGQEPLELCAPTNTASLSCSAALLPAWTALRELPKRHPTPAIRLLFFFSCLSHSFHLLKVSLSSKLSALLT